MAARTLDHRTEKRRRRSALAMILPAKLNPERTREACGSGSSVPFREYHRWDKAGMSYSVLAGERRAAMRGALLAHALTTSSGNSSSMRRIMHTRSYAVVEEERECTASLFFLLLSPSGGTSRPGK